MVFWRRKVEMDCLSPIFWHCALYKLIRVMSNLTCYCVIHPIQLSVKIQTSNFEWIFGEGKELDWFLLTFWFCMLAVVRQSSGRCWIVVEQSSSSHQAVIRQSSVSRQPVVSQSSASRQPVVSQSSASQLASSKSLLKSLIWTKPDTKNLGVVRPRPSKLIRAAAVRRPSSYWFLSNALLKSLKSENYLLTKKISEFP